MIKERTQRIDHRYRVHAGAGMAMAELHQPSVQNTCGVFSRSRLILLLLILHAQFELEEAAPIAGQGLQDVSTK